MSVNSPSFYGGCNATAPDRTIQSGPFGNGIMFEQKPAINGGQIITFSFSHMVYNYSFLLTDIDSGLDDNGIYGWSDRIVLVTPMSYTYTLPTGSSVIGKAHLLSPFAIRMTSIRAVARLVGTYSSQFRAHLCHSRFTSALLREGVARYSDSPWAT